MISAKNLFSETGARGPVRTPPMGKLIFMDARQMNEKFGQLRQRPDADIPAIAAVQDWLLRSEPSDRLRINPYFVAAQTDIRAETLISEFLHGAAAGLFELHWDIHCPCCNTVTEEFEELRGVSLSAYCTMCGKAYETDFLQHTEVTFSLNRNIEDLGLPPLSLPLPDVEVCFGLAAIYGQTVSREANLKPGRYRYVCGITNSKGILTVEGEETADTQILNLRQTDKGFEPEELRARPGKIRMVLSNIGHPISGLLVYQDDLPENSEPCALTERLTGLKILHFPAYRSLFGDQVLSDHEHLRIRFVTILFADIADSLRLYESLGDAEAYPLVRDCFEILFRNIRSHAGIEIKTVGDTVMASFQNNVNAVRAAADAISDLQKYNQEKKLEFPVNIRIGFHGGPAILVNLNQKPDYFGATVNKADLAKQASARGEISFSEEVYHDGIFKNELISMGISTVEERCVQACGREEEQKFFTIRPARSSARVMDI